jgi:hypothetical protein
MVPRDVDGLRPCDRKRIPKNGKEGSLQLREARSAAAKKRIRENGHPRGMLGKKHSDETKRILRIKSMRNRLRLTQEEVDAITEKMNKTKLERYGTAGPSIFRCSNPYSRARRGKRPDLGDIFFRSRWEANYARYLNWLISNGKIQSWRYEVKTFVFDGIKRGTLTYTPDFEVVENDGGIVYHEVKGWMDAKSKTRLKRMKKYHPDVRILVVAQKQYKEIERTVSTIIPNWEFKGK